MLKKAVVVLYFRCPIGLGFQFLKMPASAKCLLQRHNVGLMTVAVSLVYLTLEGLFLPTK
jgi:hypothetical protein